MRRLIFYSILAFVCGTVARARPVRVTLWISGGTDGVLTAGREAPGVLGVAAGFRDADADFWIDVGGSPEFALLPAEWRPDVFVPDTRFLRLAGLDGDLPRWSLLNLDRLPQYPEAALPEAGAQILRHADGPAVHVRGVLSGRAGLRVPPGRLRPLRVTDPAEAVRKSLPEVRAETGLQVLVLPEDADVRAWTRMFPDFPVLVEPAGARANVVSLDEGRRIRVRPALHGRAVVKVTLVWDSVRGVYGTPSAEVVWVQIPELSGVELPEALAARLRPLSAEAERNLAGEGFRHALAARLLSEGNADMVWLPHWEPRTVRVPDRPEGWRTALVPENDAWLRVEVSAETARVWLADPPEGGAWFGERRRGPDTFVLLPAFAAAGGDGATLQLRAGADRFADTEVRMPFTTRDLLPFHAGEGRE